MDKIKKFFEGNYDYYVIVILIVVSFMISLLSHYSLGFFSNAPCFILGQGDFIEIASLEITDLLPNLARFFGNNGTLIEIMIENILGSIFIFGLYFIGKKLFHKTKKALIKLFLKILFYVYLLIIINAAVIDPIVRCIVRIS